MIKTYFIPANDVYLHASMSRQPVKLKVAQLQYEHLSSFEFLKWIHENHTQSDHSALLFMVEKLFSLQEQESTFYQMVATEVFSNRELIDRASSWTHAQIKGLLGICMNQACVRTRNVAASFFLDPKIAHRLMHFPLKDRQSLLFLAQILMMNHHHEFASKLDIASLVGEDDVWELCQDRDASNLEVTRTLRQVAYFIDQKKLDRSLCTPFFSKSISERIAYGSCFDSKIGYLSAISMLGYTPGVEPFTATKCIKEYSSQTDPKKIVDILIHLHSAGASGQVMRAILSPSTLAKLRSGRLSQNKKIHLIEIMAFASMPSRCIENFLYKNSLGCFSGFTGDRNKVLLGEVLKKHPKLKKLVSPSLLKGLEEHHEEHAKRVVPGSINSYHPQMADQPINAAMHMIPGNQEKSGAQTDLKLRNIIGPRVSWADLYDSENE